MSIIPVYIHLQRHFPLIKDLEEVQFTLFFCHYFHTFGVFVHFQAFIKAFFCISQTQISHYLQEMLQPEPIYSVSLSFSKAFNNYPLFTYNSPSSCAPFAKLTTFLLTATHFVLVIHNRNHRWQNQNIFTVRMFSFLPFT